MVHKTAASTTAYQTDCVSLQNIKHEIQTQAFKWTVQYTYVLSFKHSYVHRLAQALLTSITTCIAKYIHNVCNTQELHGTSLVYLYTAVHSLITSSGNRITPWITNTLRYRQTHCIRTQNQHKEYKYMQYTEQKMTFMAPDLVKHSYIAHVHSLHTTSHTNISLA